MKIGDRMKEYEQCNSYRLTRKMPVIIRIDGRAFHTFTRGCTKPFDSKLIEAMRYATIATAKEMQGFKLAYTQSDEATFYINDNETHETEPWFKNKLSKILSITASLFTAHFNKRYAGEKIAVFDARAFNIPKEEVPNIFIWRQRDWERNSIQMLGRAHFSHKELHYKSKDNIKEMLLEKNICWDDMDGFLKYGTFVDINHMVIVDKLTYEDYEGLIGK